MTVLTLAARLFDVLVLNLSFAKNRLAVGNLWCTNVCFDIKLTLHAVDNNFKVKLTHA